MTPYRLLKHGSAVLYIYGLCLGSVHAQAVDTPPSPPTAAATAEPLVEYPHPLITEVLFAVPTGDVGDANKDGKRSSTGDEFVELMNPHETPINLAGYSLRDRNASDAGALRFRFPAVELEPGQIIVVFNGYEASWEGPVGDSVRAPVAAHPYFHDALVFTMANDSSSKAFANGGDYAALLDPAGRNVHCVHWGTFDEPLPENGLIEEVAGVSGESAERGTVDGPMVAHSDLAPLATSVGSEEAEPDRDRWGGVGSPGLACWVSLGDETLAAHDTEADDPSED